MALKYGHCDLQSSPFSTLFNPFQPPFQPFSISTLLCSVVWGSFTSQVCSFVHVLLNIGNDAQTDEVMRNNTGLLVYWFTGLLVYWFTGLLVLVYWFTGFGLLVLVYWFTGLLVLQAYVGYRDGQSFTLLH